jgi:hypothetical protein
MRTTRYLIPLIASAGATAVLLAPLAAADPSDEVSNLPACTTTGDGSTYTGTTTTECQTPGNVQIAATAPAPDYPYDDEFFGPALIFGGGGGGHR